MKKLFLSFAVIAGLSMISCGNKAENAAEAEAVDTVAVEEVAAAEGVEVAGEAVEVVDTVNAGTDSAAVDTVVAAVETVTAQ